MQTKGTVHSPGTLRPDAPDPMPDALGTGTTETEKQVKQAPVLKQAPRESAPGPASPRARSGSGAREPESLVIPQAAPSNFSHAVDSPPAKPTSPRRVKEVDNGPATDKVEQGGAKPFPPISDWFDHDPGADPGARTIDVIRYASISLPRILDWITIYGLEKEERFALMVAELIREATRFVNDAEDNLKTNPHGAIINLRNATRELKSILRQLKSSDVAQATELAGIASGESRAGKIGEVYKNIKNFHRLLKPLADQLAAQALPASTRPKRKQSMSHWASLPGFLTPRGSAAGPGKSGAPHMPVSRPRAAEKPAEADVMPMSFPADLAHDIQSLSEAVRTFASNCQSGGSAAVGEEDKFAAKWNKKIRALRDANKDLLTVNTSEARTVVIRLRSVHKLVGQLSTLIERNLAPDSEKPVHGLVDSAKKIMARVEVLADKAAGIVVFNSRIASPETRDQGKPGANTGRSGHRRQVSAPEGGTASPMAGDSGRDAEAVRPRSPRPTLTRIPRARKLSQAVLPVSPGKEKGAVSAPQSPRDVPLAATIPTTPSQPVIATAIPAADAETRTPAPKRAVGARVLNPPPSPRRLVPVWNSRGRKPEGVPAANPSPGQKQSSSGSTPESTVSSSETGSADDNWEQT